MSKSRISLGSSVRFANPMDGRSVGKVLAFQPVYGPAEGILVQVEWPNGGKGWFFEETLKMA